MELMKLVKELGEEAEDDDDVESTSLDHEIGMLDKIGHNITLFGLGTLGINISFKPYGMTTIGDLTGKTFETCHYLILSGYTFSNLKFSDLSNVTGNG